MRGSRLKTISCRFNKHFLQDCMLPRDSYQWRGGGIKLHHLL